MEYYTQDQIQAFRTEHCNVIRFSPKEKKPLEYFKNKKILLWTRKPGLGDMVMNAICCDILRNEYGLDVWYGCRYNPCDRDFPKILKNVPTYKYQPDLHKYPLPNDKRGFEGGVDHQGESHPFDFITDFRYHIGLRENTIAQGLSFFGINNITHPIKGLRVNDEILKNTIKYDIVLCCSTGGWKPVRAYPHNKELKKELEKKGYSVLDLIENDVAVKAKYNCIDLLSLVKNSKYYIATETGPSHLVSGVHNQSIIIQSGIHSSAFWNIYDNTKIVEPILECSGRKCYVRKHTECSKIPNSCMYNIEIEEILKHI